MRLSKRRHITNVLLTVFCIFILYTLIPKRPIKRLVSYLTGYHAINKCNPLVSPVKSKHPVIALLGSDESGVEVLRFLIEQLSGFYTGSVREANSDIFDLDGHTGPEVIAIQAEELSDLGHVNGLVVVYRKLEDIVRAQFSKKVGKGVFAEAPLRAYYGPNWKSFAINHGNRWETLYRSYFAVKKLPTLIIHYEMLLNREDMRSELNKVANFFHFPVWSTIEDCVVSGNLDETLKLLYPKKLKPGFKPFSFLPKYHMDRFRKVQSEIDDIVKMKEEKYVPLTLAAQEKV
ncbi:DgyrCDS9431 [Dimorphilus gyrociliatus]|uniref:DgyrCDS9431 n=1 Tax=Dimorphilus gyrociliatus TaxID=2664684 RepID=A0A7I8VXC1_9ANNE|nr:DgyrCDS9431 [Dimorphilus gyrociliatus]